MIEDFIKCERFGGRRPAPACVHFDRYKPCRRGCLTLAKWMKDNPDYEAIVAKAYGAKPKTFAAARVMTSKHSGKALPKEGTACKRCRFVAKTPRGLKVHMTRSHGVRT